MKKMLLTIQSKFAPFWVLVFVLLAQSARAQDLDLESEIVQAKQEVSRLQHEYAAFEQGPVKEQKYLKALQILSQEVHKRTITSEFKKQLQGAIADLDEYLNADIPVRSTLELFEFIEENAEKWKLGQDPEFFLLTVTPTQSIPVLFELDENSRIYLEYGSSFLGQGSHKKVFRVVRFEDWTPLARLEEKNSKDPKLKKALRRAFKKEKYILGKIMELPQGEQIGLIKTFHIGKKIYQEKYDVELYDLITENVEIRGVQVKLSPTQQLDVIRQLSASVQKMHQMGICIADIKPENVLVKLTDNPNIPIKEVVLADFGLSFEPRALLEKGRKRPFPGSPHYAAPEVMMGRGWLGEDWNESVKLALKSDMFSVGVTSYVMRHYNDRGGHIPWLGTDQKINFYENQGRWGDFMIRRNSLNKDFLNYLAQGPSSTPLEALDHLLAEALQFEASDRISSDIFYTKLMNIMKPASRDPISPQLLYQQKPEPGKKPGFLARLKMFFTGL